MQKWQRQSGLNKVKASALRRWPVARAYSPEQTTRFTGGHDSKSILKTLKAPKTNKPQAWRSKGFMVKY
jgi:hypothetical protein